jgi:sterol desaturase/sphingolipid hydroxylase (fatty acid hydroxylase superfamily)
VKAPTFSYKSLFEVLADVNLTQILTLTLCQDFSVFIAHYTFHRNRFLFKEIHSAHHINPSELAPIKGFEVDWREISTYMVLVLLWTSYLKTKVINIVLFGMLYQMHAYISHQPNFALPFGLGYFIEDGVNHFHHHTHPNCNYGVMLSIWDRILGTHRSPH